MEMGSDWPLFRQVGFDLAQEVSTRPVPIPNKAYVNRHVNFRGERNLLAMALMEGKASMGN